MMSRLYWLPGWTFFKKEVMRYAAAPIQTIVAPLVTAALYLFIFGVSLGERIEVHSNISYIQFVVPGLALMGLLNNSFANTSFSLFFSRYLGHIVDFLVTPLTPFQMIWAYTLASITRGLIIGAAVLLISSFFTTLPWTYPGWALAMAVLSAFFMSQLGLIAGIYSDTFESISMYTTFLLLPLIYLGGMFYPVSILPPFWARLSQFNPLFYAIDGFRHCLVGTGDVSIARAFAMTGGLALVMFLWAAWLLHRGYNLRK